jgi:hypothetical protein
MWHLKQRTDHPHPKTWHELGTFASICDATKKIVAIEDDPSPNAGAIFFQVYCWHAEERTDAHILSRLEYQGRRGVYIVTRQRGAQIRFWRLGSGHRKRAALF